VSFPSRPSAPAPKGQVLVVASAARIQTLADGSKRKTGTFLGELYEPYRALVKAQHGVVLSTIDGAEVAIDPESLKQKYWHSPERLAEALRFVATEDALRSPVPLGRALTTADDFQGLIIPGGQGVMVDLLDHPDVHSLLARFAARDKPIGLVCHAPALLTRMKEPGPLARRSVTSVSGFEELFIETFVVGEEASVRRIGRSLAARGYRHSTGFPGSSHAIRDCNLVTSQNPFSTDEFNQLYLDALHDFRRGGRCAR
jgi:putative intracellular protease/amidase